MSNSGGCSSSQHCSDDLSGHNAQHPLHRHQHQQQPEEQQQHCDQHQREQWEPSQCYGACSQSLNSHPVRLFLWGLSRSLSGPTSSTPCSPWSTAI